MEIIQEANDGEMQLARANDMQDDLAAACRVCRTVHDLANVQLCMKQKGNGRMEAKVKSRGKLAFA
jgi:hypothetical protein